MHWIEKLQDRYEIPLLLGKCNFLIIICKAMQFGCIQRLDFTVFRFIPMHCALLCMPCMSAYVLWLCALRCVMQCIRLFYWMNRAIQCALVDASMRLNNNKNQLDLIDLVWIRKHCSKKPDSNSVTISIYLYTHKYTPFYTQIRAHRFDVALNFIASIYDGNLP